MKRIIKCLLVFLLCLFVIGLCSLNNKNDVKAASAISYWDGSVDRSWFDNNPNASSYNITTASQFAGFATISKNYNFNKKTINLMVDINLNYMVWNSIGGKDGFYGTFNGNGHKIDKIKIQQQSSSSDCFGLFSVNVGTITNVIIYDIEIDISFNNRELYVGAIAGFNKNKINNCIVGTITSNTTVSESSKYRNPFHTVGGIAGSSENGVIEKCLVLGGNIKVNSSTTGNACDAWTRAYGGGIVGRLVSGTVSACYNEANVITSATHQSDGTFYTIFKKYVFHIYSFAGGIVGLAKNGIIVDCSSSCSTISNLSARVNGTKHGGCNSSILDANGDIVARSDSGSLFVSNCYKRYEAVVGSGPVSTNSYNFKFTNFGSLPLTLKNALTFSLFNGEGTKESPYLIKNKEQLHMLSWLSNKGISYSSVYFSLSNSIDFNNEIFTPICSTGEFKGIIDGDNYRISNIRYNTSKKVLGFIGYNQGTIKNIKFDNVSLSSNVVYAECFGGVVGFNNGTVINCSVKMNVEAKFTAKSFIGGIAGCSQPTSKLSSSVNNCSVTGKLVISGSSETSYIGGIVGSTKLQIYKMIEINNCYTNLDMTVDHTNGIIGGIVGSANCANITYCYSSGSLSVKQAKHVGGIVGTSFNISINNVYNNLNVVTSNTTINAIIADTSNTSVINSYYFNSNFDNTLGGSLINDTYFNESNYVNFDFNEYWAVNGNIEYPYPVLRSNLHLGSFIDKYSLKQENDYYVDLNGLKYQLDNENKKAIIIGYNLQTEKVTIKQKVIFNSTEYTVQEIGTNAFKDNKELKQIVGLEYINKIGDYAFSGCSALTDFTILACINEVGSYAFSDCNNLKEVKIENGISKISEGLFKNCSNLTLVNIPDSILLIESYAFSDCNSLTIVSIGNNVKKINEYAFNNNSNLGIITIGKGIEEIENNGFYNCSKLISIIFIGNKNNITTDFIKNPEETFSIHYNEEASNWNGILSYKIGSGFVSDLSGEFMVYSQGDEKILDENKRDYDYGFQYSLNSSRQTAALIGVGSYNGEISNVKISSKVFYNGVSYTVTEVGNFAFMNRLDIKNIFLPKTINYIGNEAFAGCSYLNIHYANSGSSLIRGSYYNFDIANEYDYSNELLQNENFEYIINNERMIILRYIGSNEKIEINNDVDVIASKAFYNNTLIKEVTLNSTDLVVANNVFSGCSNLERVILRIVPVNTGSNIFTNTTRKLEVLSINNNNENEKINWITSWGNRYVAKVIALENIGKYDKWQNIVYTLNKDSLTAQVGKTSVNAVGSAIYNNEFSYQDFDEIIIPDYVFVNEEYYRVTSFDRYAFYGMLDIKKIVFGANIGLNQTKDKPAIWDCTFRNCHKDLVISVDEDNPYYQTIDNILFDKVEFMDGDTVIAGSIRLIMVPKNKDFINGSYVIPDNIKIIENYAFNGVTKLKSVVLNNTQIIGDFAFKDSGLESITFTDKVEEIGTESFANCQKLVKVIISKSVNSIGSNAFGNCLMLEEISVNSENINYKSIEGLLYKLEKESVYDNLTNTYVDSYVLLKCPTNYNKSEIVIPENVSCIWDYAFDNVNVNTISLGDSVTTLRPYAINNCSLLTTINIGNKLNDIMWLAINDCRNLSKTKVSTDNINYYTDANGVLYSTDMKTLILYPANIGRVSYVIPDTVETISVAAFKNNANIVSVVIPKDIKYIEADAFYGCKSLQSIYFSGNMPEYIGNNIAFSTGNENGLIATLYYKTINKELWKDFKINDYKDCKIAEYVAVKEVENTNVDDEFYSFVITDSFGNALDGFNIEFDGVLYDDVSVNGLINVDLKKLNDCVNVVVNDPSGRFYPFMNDQLILDKKTYLTYITMFDIPTVTGISCEDVDINSAVVKINTSSMFIDEQGNIMHDKIDIKVLGYSANGTIISKYSLIQNNEIIYSESYLDSQIDDIKQNGFGNALYTLKNIPANKFMMDTPISVAMEVIGKGESDYKDIVTTLLNVNILCFDPPIVANDSGGSFNVPCKDIPLLGNASFSLEIDKLKRIFTIEEDKITLGFGSMPTKKSGQKLKELNENVNNGMKEYLKKMDKVKKVSTQMELEFDVYIGGYVVLEYSHDVEDFFSKLYINVKGCVTFKYEIGHTLTYIYVPIRLELEFNAMGELRFSAGYDFEADKLFMEVGGRIEASLTARAGIGCSYVSVGIYGKAVFIFDFTLLPTPAINEITLDGEFGFYVKIKIPLIFTFYDEFKVFSTEDPIIIYETTDGKKEKAKLNDLILDINNYKIASSEEKIDVDSFGQLFVMNNKLYLMYLTDSSSNANYDEYNYQKIAYKEITKDGFGNEVILDDNGYSDGEFSIYQDGTETYVIYSQVDIKLNTVSTVDDYLQASNVKMAKLNDSGVEYISNVNDNNKYEMNLQLAKIEGVLTLCWVENADNNVFGMSSEYKLDENDPNRIYPVVDTNSIWLSQFINGNWSEAKCIVNNEKTISSIAIANDNNGINLAYIYDEDCNISTVNDQTIQSVKLDKNIEVQENVKMTEPDEYANLSVYNNKITYYYKNNIHYLNEKETLINYDVESLGSKYQILYDENNEVIAISFVGVDTDHDALYAIYYDKEDQVFGEPIKIFDFTKGFVLENYSCVIKDNKTYINYILVKEEDETRIEEYQEIDINNNICLDYVNIEYDSITMNSAGLNISITNLSPVKITNLSFLIKDPFDNVLNMNNMNIYEINNEEKTLINKDNYIIYPGVNKELYLEINDITILENEYHLTINSNIEEDSIDNTLAFKLGYADMTVEAKHIIQGTRNFIAIYLENIGYISTTAKIYVIKNAYSSTETTLPNKDTAIYYLDTAVDLKYNFEYGKRGRNYVIEVDDVFFDNLDGAGIVTIYIESEKDEYNKVDNYAYLAVVEKKAVNVDPNSIVFSSSLSINKVRQNNAELKDIVLTINENSNTFKGIKGLTKDIDFTYNEQTKEVVINTDCIDKLNEGRNELIFEFITTNEEIQERILTVNIDMSRYDISFIVDDDVLIKKYNINEEVVYDLDVFKTADNIYTYTFAGWDANGDGQVDYIDNTFPPATTRATYIAIFDKTYIEYNIKCYDTTGKIISNDNYHYMDYPKLPELPVMTADLTYTYPVTWDSTITNVTEDKEYKQVITPTYIDYTITFINYDNAILSSKNDYHYNDQIIEPNNVVKEKDNTFTYKFVGWDSDITTVDGNKTYKAVYSSTYIDYTIKFVNYDNNIITENDYHYQDEVVIPNNPTRSEDKIYQYQFIGWDSDITVVNESKTYKAVYKAINIKYKVIFNNYNNDLLQANEYNYNDKAIIPVAPHKLADEVYTYKFIGWDYNNDDVVDLHPSKDLFVIDNVTYKALYKNIYVNYKVRFINSDNSLIDEKTDYHYGDVIVAPKVEGVYIDKVYEYAFNGWDKPLEVVKNDITYKATYKKDYVIYDINFVQPDGTIIITKDYHYNDTVIAPLSSEFTLAPDERYEYEFIGWDSEIENVTANKTYKAVYKQKDVIYTITYIKPDGSEYQNYKYDELIVVLPGPTKEDDKTYKYTFTSWNGYFEGMTVTKNTTFTAEYTKTYIDYIIKFEMNGEVKEEKYHYNDTINTPTVSSYSDKVYRYEFNSWQPLITTVNSNKTYKAIYDKKYIDYTISFIDGNNQNVKTQIGHYEDIIVAPTDLPNMSDDTYTYEFIGWDKAFSKIYQDDVIKAVYKKTYKEYVITFRYGINDGDKEIDSTNYHYNDVIKEPTTPTKPSDKKYDYTFIGWDKVITPVRGNVTYTAVFKESFIDYTITFVNYDEKVLQIKKLHYEDEVVYSASTPEKASDDKYDYIFNGWDSQLTNVTEDRTYKAVFISKARLFTIILKDSNKELIQSKQYPYASIIEMNEFKATKASDEKYNYVFIGWDLNNDSIVDIEINDSYKVINDIVMIALFKEEARLYKVEFLYDDGIVYQTDYYKYNDTITLPKELTKENNKQYIYEFDSWEGYNSNLLVTSDLSFKAKFKETKIEYNCYFYGLNNELIEKVTLFYNDEIVLPNIEKTIIDNDTFKYEFKEFTNYTPGMKITDDISFYAVYVKTPLISKEEITSKINKLKYISIKSFNDLKKVYDDISLYKDIYPEEYTKLQEKIDEYNRIITNARKDNQESTRIENNIFTSIINVIKLFDKMVVIKIKRWF